MCDICRQTPCISKCPNYVPLKAQCYCDKCGEGIYPDEEYIINDNDEYAHYDCFFSIRELLEWLNCEIKTMDVGL